MALDVIWSKRAAKKFQSIVDYLQIEWGDTVTSAFIRKTNDLLDILKEFPEVGSIEIPDREVRGFLVTKQVRLFYRIKGKQILLLNFFDTRQRPK